MAPRQKLPKEADQEKTLIKDFGHCAAAAGGNVAAIDVKNGKIIRIRPMRLDWKYKPEEFNAWQIEARGKVFRPDMKSLLPPHSLGYKKRAYSPNRVKYPLKRVDWDPKGDRHPENRGKSSFVRISWDEAIEIIASELKRTIKEYGPYAIYMHSSAAHGQTKYVHGGHGCMAGLLDLLGGFTYSTRNPDSWEGWYWGAKHVWGMDPCGLQEPSTNVLNDVSQYTELMIFIGCDFETTPWGFGNQSPSQWCYWFTELGIKAIYVSPDLNYAAAVHADKWIPVLPNTDAAMHLAIAYQWLTEGTYDKDYVATHTFGFDKFADYVLGKEDGIVKTPKWAAEKCGVPSRIIKALAKEWASKITSTAHYYGGSYVRGPYAHEVGRLEVLLLAMQGLGKPGVQQFHPGHGILFNDKPAEPKPLFKPNLYPAWRGWDNAMEIVRFGYEYARKKVSHTLCDPLIAEGILNPPVSWYGSFAVFAPLEDSFVKYTYPEKGAPEIHMIWTDRCCFTTCWNGGNKLVEAYRSPKIEFILSEHPWLENDCIYTDLILPVTVKFEEEDVGLDAFSGRFATMCYEGKCIEPVGESKSDYEITCLIADKLGLLEKYTEGKSNEEWMRLGFQLSGAADYISFEKFKENGYWVVPTDPKWKTYSPGSRDFYEDPEAHPLQTPSGKLEFYSQNLAKYFPGDKERGPVPHWIEKGESHDERLSSERAKKYPLLICSNHGRWRVHAQLDDITWFHEIETGKVRGPDGYLYEPMWIHPQTAAERGIRHGDVAKIFNERGGVLCGAYVTERIRPGVVYIDHGARLDPIVPGELDRGGAINTISPRNTTSKNATGMATSGYLVQVERVNLDELRKKYPEAFNRPYDQASGLRMERVYVGGEQK